ncbi:MAG TPA: hypothetical protein VNM45_19835 [Bacillus sp. (in: firmicutes)]|nr:hypothetical protein [Bacillus sp. (in: firmicutes)]
MTLKIILRVVGVLLLLLGIYLIFADSAFLGAVSIIVACLLFPGGKGGKRSAGSYDHDDDYDFEDTSDGDSGGDG